MFCAEIRKKSLLDTHSYLELWNLLQKKGNADLSLEYCLIIMLCVHFRIVSDNSDEYKQNMLGAMSAKSVVFLMPLLSGRLNS